MFLVKAFTRSGRTRDRGMNQPNISDSAVRRLSLYLRALRELQHQGEELVSSQDLARRCGATSAQIRKDLSLFGSFGKRGRGYSVAELVSTLERILGLQRRWRVALVGAGKIGSALMGYRDLARRGFDLVAAFDTAPSKIGRIVGDVEVSPLARLESIVAERGVEIGIIATPPEAAQKVAERLWGAGVRAVLSFAPVKLVAPDAAAVRTVDVVLELEGLSYELTAADELAPRGPR